MNRKLQVLLHIAIWGVVLVMPILLQFRSNPDMPVAWKIYPLITSGTYLLAFYSSFFLLSSIVIRTKSVWKNILVFLVSGTIVYAIKFGLISYLDIKFDQAYSQAQVLSLVVISSDYFNTFLIMVVALLIRISMKWFQDQKIKSEMLFQQQTQELALLKAQVNPHFFFNTLNNIYSLVYKKSDDAPAALLKLSEIMRYMIYDSKTDTVPLPNELEHLENYLELEKLRLKDPNFISYQVDGDAAGKMIPPMLLLSFVENAFKHGKKRVKNPGITIRLNIESDRLHFMVANYTLGKKADGSEAGGIGLKNITRRLELLYPGKHSLHILDESDQYVVNLELIWNPVINN